MRQANGVLMNGGAVEWRLNDHFEITRDLTTVVFSSVGPVLFYEVSNDVFKLWMCFRLDHCSLPGDNVATVRVENHPPT